MDTLYNQNLSYLEQHEPELYQSVVAYVAENQSGPSYTLITEPVLNIQIEQNEQSQLYYSKYNPAYESKRLIDSLEIIDNASNGIVMYGLGLTYHLVELLDAYPIKQVFIFEPELGVFVEAMKVLEIDKLFEHANVIKIIVGYTSTNLSIFTNYLYHFAFFPIQIVDLPIYRTINPEQLVTFLRKIEQTSITKLFSHGFHKSFGNEMHINSLVNLNRMIHTPSLRRFKNMFKGATMFVIGGGPSLQDDIEYIKQVKDDVFIVAAGSSVQGLMHYGIEPHLIASMDPGIPNYNVFADGRFNDIPLLYFPQIHRDIVKVHDKLNIYAYYDNDEVINKLVDSKISDISFDPTYSISGTVIQLAKFFDVKRVVMTGQDLSYPGKQIYSPGATHYTDGTGTAELTDMQLIDTSPNVSGGVNPTTFSMRKTLENIEENIIKLVDIEFINASSRGAVVKGTTFMPMEKVIELDLKTNYNFGCIKEMLLTIEDPTINEEFKHLNETVKGRLLELSAYSAKLKKVKNKLKKLVKLSSTNFYKAETLLRELETDMYNLLDDKIFKDFINEWIIIEMDIYDKRIIILNNEPNLEKKAELVEITVGELISTIQEKIELMKPLLNDILTSNASDMN